METSWTLPVQKHKFSDLYLCFCGYEACQPFHSYGPAVRPNYVIHYIISGKGTFTIGNRTYRLTAGQGFFLMPNVRTYYEADAMIPGHISGSVLTAKKLPLMYRNSVFPRSTLSTSATFPVNCSPSCFRCRSTIPMTPRTSIFWKAVCTSFSQFFPAKSRLPILLHGRAAIFTWKKLLSLSEIIIPMKFLSRILPDMYASTGVTFIPCFRNISIPHRRTIFLPAGSRVRSSFYRIRISPSKRSLFPVVTGMPKFLPKPSARSRA